MAIDASKMGITAELLCQYQQLAHQQLAQQQLAQRQLAQRQLVPYSLQMQSGTQGGMLGSVSSDWGTTTSTQGMQQIYQTAFQPQQYSYKTDYNRTLHFYRINERVSYNEGQIISEPLDELRIQVAKWLYN